MIKDAIIVLVGTLVILSIFGTMDREAAEAEAAHKEEIISAAKKEYARQQYEKQLSVYKFRNDVYLTSPKDFTGE